jgi:hypothetical protein
MASVRHVERREPPCELSLKPGKRYFESHAPSARFTEFLLGGAEERPATIRAAIEEVVITAR